MPPPMQRFAGGPNNLSAHYQQYPAHTQPHTTGLPPSALGVNPSFVPNSNVSAFAVNGNSLSLAGGFGAAAGMGVGAASGLGSHAAQMGFAHGASLQQQAQHGMAEPTVRGGGKGRIIDVWKHNLHDEIEVLRKLVDKYSYIAMDTEFPGLVARPMGRFRGKSDYHYQTLRCNVDLLKIIQIGITLFNADGETPPARPPPNEAGLDGLPPSRRMGNPSKTALPCTWQFNFRFSLKDDMYSQASIEALQQAGVDFVHIERDGIDPFEFAALLISSGLVCDEDVHWISFHGGYDFGYLMKLLTCKQLPDDEVEFEMLMKKFFPSIWDVKFLMKYAIKLNQVGQLTPLDAITADCFQKFEQKPGLETLADSLKVKRQGQAHQAGSDSLLTGKIFFSMRDRIFGQDLPRDCLGKVWGLGLPDFGSLNAQNVAHYQQLQENATPGGQNGNGYSNGGPSTPNTTHAGLAGTPSHNAHTTNGIGPLTPGGGGGVFGNFFSKQ